jgi:hypothetical protein
MPGGNYQVGRMPAPPPASGVVTKSGGNIKASGVGGGTGPGSAGNTGGGSAAANQATNATALVAELRPSGTLAPAMTPEEQRLNRLRSKLQPTILTLVLRLTPKQQAEVVNYGGFIREGKAEVQLWLTDKSDVAKAKLKELGFEVVLDHAASNLMIGRIPVDKLALLADLEFVRYVSPQTSR